ncbi:MAG: hypothetical protein J5J00_03915 [Deltaproteobacteria bacterium]|nr:hypothetical protein [Deltaproteobacteria bacterium]
MQSKFRLAPLSIIMLFFLQLALLSGFTPRLVLAQAKAGSAELAMLSERWPCREARASELRSGLKELHKVVLWHTFGNSTECLQSYMSDPNFKTLEIHLINEVCQRHQNCGEYEFLAGLSVDEYDRKLIARDAELMKKLDGYFSGAATFLAQYLKPHTQCFVSPGLESNLSIEAAKVALEKVKTHFPQCKAVWNPVGNSRHASPIQGTIFEMHGKNPDVKPPCIADLDGTDIHFPARKPVMRRKIQSSKVPEYFERYRQCEHVFLWVGEFNGISSPDNFIDPRERTNFPSPQTFDLVYGLLAEQQEGGGTAR